MSEDDRRCAEVCEANGFLRQANLFRGLADGHLPVYLVVESERGFDREEGTTEGGEPRLLYLDRDGAEEEAARQNLRAFRSIRTSDPCCESLQYGMHPISELERGEFIARVGEVLSGEYTIPEGDDLPLFPPSMTDDHARQIMEFCQIRFFDVSELEIQQGGDHG